MSNFYVYEHWRLDLDVCFYVGKGKKGRAYSRSNRNDDWWDVVKELESTGSSYEIRIVVDGITSEEALKIERERILFWRSVGDYLTNKRRSGNKGATGIKRSAAENKAKSEIMISLFRGPKGELLRKQRSENATGEKHGCAKLTEEQAIAIRADTRTVKQIAEEYGIKGRQVRRIKSGERWGHLDTLLVPPADAHTGRKAKARTMETLDV
jgi:hypothetical protein